MSKLSRILLALSFVMLAIAVYVPMWRIDLVAPQYPEGLYLQIYPNRLGGNVDIINGLNHYIGMKTLHTEDFFEFRILPYIIGFFSLACLVVSIAGRKILLRILLATFFLFGVVAMYDFWKWEYDYGHNLNPHAAIIVPGMSYQPPLIGYKQLLNFSAYSFPDIGGWLFFVSGIFMLFSVIYDHLMKGKNVNSKKIKNVASMSLQIFLLSLFFSCGDIKPEPVVLNRDQCHYCKMTISDPRYASEGITSKRKVYKFDDVSCLKDFIKKNPTVLFSHTFVASFKSPHNLISVDSLKFAHGSSFKSPMGGNIAAFADSQSAFPYISENNATWISWDQIVIHDEI